MQHPPSPLQLPCAPPQKTFEVVIFGNTVVEVKLDFFSKDAKETEAAVLELLNYKFEADTFEAALKLKHQLTSLLNSTSMSRTHMCTPARRYRSVLCLTTVYPAAVLLASCAL